MKKELEKDLDVINKNLFKLEKTKSKKKILV
jgi:hypothetical protein